MAADCERTCAAATPGTRTSERQQLVQRVSKSCSSAARATLRLANNSQPAVQDSGLACRKVYAALARSPRLDAS